MPTQTDYQLYEQLAHALKVLARPRTRVELAARLGVGERTAGRLLAALTRLRWVRVAPGSDSAGGRGRVVRYVATHRITRR